MLQKIDLTKHSDHLDGLPDRVRSGEIMDLIVIYTAKKEPAGNMSITVLNAVNNPALVVGVLESVKVQLAQIVAIALNEETRQ